MTLLELLLELVIFMAILTGAGVLEDMFKIWLKSVEFEGIKNAIKDL